MEKSALELLQQTANIPFVLGEVAKATSKAPIVVVPNGYGTLDLEDGMECRMNYRGVFSTESVVDYVAYIKIFDAEGSKCFINAAGMSAKTVFDLGDVERPKHQKHAAKLSLVRTVAYDEVLNINGKKLDQKTLSDWLEDWKDCINVVGNTGEPLTAMAAASAVRKITIEASRKMDSEVGDFSANMTALERIEATSSMVMPSMVYFTCRPYRDLTERNFCLRVSILTSGEKPVLVMRVVQLEAMQEAMTEEFKDKLVTMLLEEECNTTTLIGSFN